jgi:flagellar biosynthesis protein FlhF
MSKSSVEVTAAVSERSITKKKNVEARLPEKVVADIQKMPAAKQVQIQDKMGSGAVLAVDQIAGSTRDQVQLSQRPRTAVRYAEIDDTDEVAKIAKPAVRAQAQVAYGGTPVAPQSSTSPSIPPSASRQDVVSPVVQTSLQSKEMESLKRMIEELRTQQSEAIAQKAVERSDVSAFSTPALQEAFDQLVVQGIDRRFALNLIRQAGFELSASSASNIDAVLDQVASEILEGIQTADPLEGVVAGTGSPTVMALVGPTGVGKTTTLAKIAAQGLKKGLRVGLINLDYVKASAFEQLATFARLLNLPFRSAHSVDDLSFAIRDFSTLDLILVDTTGRSQRDPESLNEIHSMLTTIPSMKTLLVLSATTRDAEMYDMASRFSVFRPQGLVFSKLDETTLYGAIYNVPQKVRLPLLYFTTGQKVPEDIEKATAERVVSLVMDL